jgi:hypothetical protein
MHTLNANVAQEVRQQMRAELLRLAKGEEIVAADLAARVHYWEPLPLSVSSHRRCASVLRSAADAIDSQHSALPSAAAIGAKP